MAEHNLQVTLTTGTTRFSSSAILCRQLMMQNNSAHGMRVGDAMTSASRGVILQPNGTMNVNQPSLLSDWYVFGTAGEVLDVIYLD